MTFANLKDESYIREQVELDMDSGGRYRFAGNAVKQHADNLRNEMDRRRLRFSPIGWHL
jgi:hypothetical protein